MSEGQRILARSGEEMVRIMTVLLLIGTAKGLFVARSDEHRKGFDLGSVQFPMTGVYSVGIDRRGPTPRLFAGVTSSHYGPTVAVSDDLGQTWREPATAPI